MSAILSTALLTLDGASPGPLHRSMEGTRAKNVLFHYTPEERTDINLFAGDPFALLSRYGLGRVKATNSKAAHEIVDFLLIPRPLQILTHDLPRHWEPELMQDLAVGMLIWKAAHWRRPQNGVPQGGSCVVVDALPDLHRQTSYQAIREHLARLPYALRPASVSLTPEAASFENGGRILLSTPRSSPPRGFQHDWVLYLGADLIAEKRRIEHVQTMEQCVMTRKGSIWLYCANPTSLLDSQAIGNSRSPLLLHA